MLLAHMPQCQVHEPLALLGGMLSFYFVTRAVESSPAFKAFLRKMPSKTLFAVTSGILLFNGNEPK